MISTDNLLKIVIITTVACEKGRQGEEPLAEQFLKPVTLGDIEEVFSKLSQAATTTQTTQAAQAATEATQAPQAATEATQGSTSDSSCY